MAKLLGAELHVLISRKRRALRYLELGVRTLKLLIKRRPETVYCQNPSLLLTTLCGCLKAVIGYKLIVDAHNAGLFPLENKSHLLTRLATSLTCSADAVFVSNRFLAYYLKARGGNAIVLPDPIPEIHAAPTGRRWEQLDLHETNYVLVAGSWATDEPYEQILKASEILSAEKLLICFTGRAPESVKRKRLPKNVRLLGYVASDLYDALLTNSAVIVVLTKRENCLTCGAYEALAVRKPAVLSATRALLEYFPEGFAHTTHKPYEIARAIREQYLSHDVLTGQTVTRLQLEAIRAQALCELDGVLSS